MSRNVHREIINGRMTVTRVRRIKGAEYKVTVDRENLFGKVVGTQEITKRKPGYDCVEVLVYDGPKAEGEPVGEWEMPIQLRYSLHDAALLAERQTDGHKK